MIVIRKYKDMYVVYNKVNRNFYYFCDIANLIFEMILKNADMATILEKIRNEYQIDSIEEVESDCLEMIQFVETEVLNTKSESSETDNVYSDHLNDTSSGELIEISTENDILDYATEQLIPFSATWEVIDSCNLNCIHCYCSNTNTTVWTLERAKLLIDKLYDMGTMDLEITGGECLVHPNIKEIFEYINQKGFVVSILTNAIAVDEQMAILISTLMPRNVQVSIYSLDPEIHDSITGVTGSLAKSLAGIKILAQNKIRISIATPVMDINIDHIHSLHLWAKECNYEINFSFKMSPSGNLSKDPSKRSVINNVDFDEKLNVIFSDLEYNTKLMKIVDKPRRVKPDSRKLCQAGFRNICIDYKGTVFPCNSLRYGFGNFLEADLFDIWHSENAQSWRNISIDNYPKCASCSARFYCEPCPADYFAQTGELFEIDEQSCVYGKKLFEAVKEHLARE